MLVSVKPVNFSVDKLKHQNLRFSQNCPCVSVGNHLTSNTGSLVIY